MMPMGVIFRSAFTGNGRRQTEHMCREGAGEARHKHGYGSHGD